MGSIEVATPVNEGTQVDDGAEVMLRLATETADELTRVTIFRGRARATDCRTKSGLIPTADKIRLVNQLSGCRADQDRGHKLCVSPKWVPQMADATDVFAGIERRAGVSYAALTPNMKGYEGARAAKADEIAVFASASEGFSQKNINCSIDESIERFKPVLAEAKADGLPVRGYVSCVTDCPYDGPTPPQNVARVAKALMDMGCYEISLGDTIGAATPLTISQMLEAVQQVVPVAKLAGHFHDTKGRP